MRKNFLRNITACFLAVCVLTGCKKDDNHYSSINSITADVENGAIWEEYVDFVYAFIGKNVGNRMQLEIVAEEPYDKGSFKINLHSNIDNSYLQPLQDGENTNFPEWIKISDKTAMATTTLFLLGANSEDFTGRFYQEKEFEEGDNFKHSYSYSTTDYLYVNKDVSLKGSLSQDSAFNVGILKYKVQFKEVADISLKKGWNIIYSTTKVDLKKRGNDVTGTISYKESTQKVDGLKWYYNLEDDLVSYEKSVISKKLNFNKSETILKIETKTFKNTE